MPDCIVIVGGGHAGAQAVDSLRRDGFAGRLVLVAGEPALPYQRPPLSKKFLAGEFEADRLPIRHAQYYETIHCEVLLGNPATAIDTAICRDERCTSSGEDSFAEMDRALTPMASAWPRAMIPRKNGWRRIRNRRAMEWTSCDSM